MADEIASAMTRDIPDARDAVELARVREALIASLAIEAVRRFHPKLPPAALKPCFLSGADLIAAGGKPGPAFHQVIDEAAKLQRAGKLKTRVAALAWLKKRSA